MTLRQAVLASAGVGVALALGLAAATVTTASARAGPSTVGGNTVTYTDPVGDATSGAPDITGVTAKSDASGTVTFVVTTGGYTDLTDASDLHRHRSQQCDGITSSGCELMLDGLRLADGVYAAGTFRWVNGDWAEAAKPASLAFAMSGGNATFTISKADLGVTTGFSFWVGTGRYDTSGNLLGEDHAPNYGLWSFDLNAAPTTTAPAVAVKPLIGAPATTPARAVAGKRFTVSFPVTRSDTGKPLASGTMTCDPSVSGKVIQHAESFGNGTARLSFVIPKTAKGKLLTVKLTIKAGGSATKIATFRVG